MLISYSQIRSRLKLGGIVALTDRPPIYMAYVNIRLWAYLTLGGSMSILATITNCSLMIVTHIIAGERNKLAILHREVQRKLLVYYIRSRKSDFL